jgi:hypothetical protein
MAKVSKMSDAEYAALTAAVLAAREAGMSTAKCQVEFGLNHMQVAAITYRARITQDMRDSWTEGGATLGERAVAARANGMSWGMMGYIANVPEGSVRAAFAATSATKSQGLRIGKGGRYYYGDPELYAEALVTTGTTIAVGSDHAAARHASQIQRVTRLAPEALFRVGTELGCPRNKSEALTAYTNRLLVHLGLVEAKAKAPAAKKVSAPRKPRSTKRAAQVVEVPSVEAPTSPAELVLYGPPAPEEVAS